ncbi:lactate racemase domain-containing protein [Chloroflexota bacterium]
MPNIISLPQVTSEGNGLLELPLPGGWQVEICNMVGNDRPAMTDEQIRSAVANPAGIEPVRKLAKGKKSAVIIFDDITRITKVSRIVPFVLEELAEAGIADENISFIAALGTHGIMNRADFARKLGDSILARFPVFNHNPFFNCTYVGTTSNGTEVAINAEVMNCDVKIAIGSITPHRGIMFGGGAKIILPGVSSLETILHNHQLPHGEPNLYETNTMHLDMIEAAELAGLDIKIDCIVNGMGETAAIYAGTLAAANEAGVSDAKAHYLTPKAEEKDIVIANTFIKVSESASGLAVAYPSLKQTGGDVVLISNAPDGQTVHYLMGPWGRNVRGKIPVQFPVPPHVKRLINYTEYPDTIGLMWLEDTDRVCQMNDWEKVLRTLEADYGDKATVAVYPNSDIQYFD